MMRRSRSLPSWVGVALTLFFSLSAAPIARAADGWATLWSQNCAAAKPLFQKAASGAGAADARRGLGLIAQCEDAPGTAAEQWRTIYAVAPDSWQAAAYWQEFADAARDSGKEPVLIDAARAILARKKRSVVGLPAGPRPSRPCRNAVQNLSSW